MLERAELLIGAWERTPGRPPGPWRRPVLDPLTNVPLGLVRYAAPWPRPSWPWRRPCLEVSETADDALLMSLRRSLLSREAWSARDAEGSFLGNLLAGALLDPYHERFAERRPVAPGSWVLRELTGREYARLDEGPDGTGRLTFPDARLTNPFLRMLVLGSFLLLHPFPPVPTMTT